MCSLIIGVVISLSEWLEMNWRRGKELLLNDWCKAVVVDPRSEDEGRKINKRLCSKWIDHFKSPDQEGVLDESTVQVTCFRLAEHSLTLHICSRVTVVCIWTGNTLKNKYSIDQSYKICLLQLCIRKYMNWQLIPQTYCGINNGICKLYKSVVKNGDTTVDLWRTRLRKKY